MTNKRALYDSYIRAIRWASDRVGDAGVIAFVSNGGWVDGNITDGMRKSLADEFSSIDVFHLRGNQRTSGERSRKEGGKIFGSGSRAPIAITVLAKNPSATASRIRFHDIGDYLSRDEKLQKVAAFASMQGIGQAGGWTEVHPDDDGTWVNQGQDEFETFVALASKDGAEDALFTLYSAGMKTNRDAWCYNASEQELSHNISRSIEFFNSLDKDHSPEGDDMHFKWCGKTLEDLQKGRRYEFSDSKLRLSSYRPFNRQWLYMDSRLNWSKYLTDRYFPDSGSPNRVICLSAPGFRGGFSALMSDALPSIHFGDMAGAQCFPRYLYEVGGGDLLDPDGGRRTDGITDVGLKRFRDAYPDLAVTKDDLFHYVYGLLHSEEYKVQFADNLSKQLPRIPIVAGSERFLAFVEAGRRLSDLHCDYDNADPYPVTFSRGDTALVPPPDPAAFYRVEQMKFSGKKPKQDKTSIVYNGNITVTGIPPEAYEYVVNGKSAIEWVMERQGVKTDNASGIVNDANRYAIETMGDPAYPLKLLQRVITVSVETMKVVKSLPKLKA